MWLFYALFILNRCSLKLNIPRWCRPIMHCCEAALLHLIKEQISRCSPQRRHTGYLLMEEETSSCQRKRRLWLHNACWQSSCLSGAAFKDTRICFCRVLHLVSSSPQVSFDSCSLTRPSPWAVPRTAALNIYNLRFKGSSNICSQKTHHCLHEDNYWWVYGHSY